MPQTSHERRRSTRRARRRRNSSTRPCGRHSPPGGECSTRRGRRCVGRTNAVQPGTPSTNLPAGGDGVTINPNRRRPAAKAKPPRIEAQEAPPLDPDGEEQRSERAPGGPLRGLPGVPAATPPPPPPLVPPSVGSPQSELPPSLGSPQADQQAEAGKVTAIGPLEPIGGNQRPGEAVPRARTGECGPADLPEKRPRNAAGSRGMSRAALPAGSGAGMAGAVVAPT